MRVLALLLCSLMVGCTDNPVAPIAVQTGQGTEAVGKYEVYVVPCVGPHAQDAQVAICGWLTAHPDLKFVWGTEPIRRNSGMSDYFELTVVGYRADDKHDNR